LQVSFAGDQAGERLGETGFGPKKAAAGLPQSKEKCFQRGNKICY